MPAIHVAIVGAGIAGLALTSGLLRAGHQVSLVERSPQARAVGAGLVLQPNALAAADRCGLDLRPLGQRLGRGELRDQSGRLLQGMDLPALEPRHGPALAVHRAELHALLQRSAEGAELRLGDWPTALSLGPEGPSLRLNSGAALQADLIIGADGLRSGLRELLRGPAGPQVRYSGYTCWRLVLEGPELAGTTEMWGRGRRVGLVPLSGGRIYVFLVADAPANASAPPDLDALFADFGPPWSQARPLLPSATVLHHDIEELDRVDFGGPRCWLVGDAAHAMTPNLGQGAGLALEDAAQVLEALARFPSLDEAHRQFAASRLPRVEELKRGSQRIGAVGQWSHPAAVWLRDRLAALAPAGPAMKQLEQIYAWRPGDALTAPGSGPRIG